MSFTIKNKEIIVKVEDDGYSERLDVNIIIEKLEGNVKQTILETLDELYRKAASAKKEYEKLNNALSVLTRHEHIPVFMHPLLLPEYFNPPTMERISRIISVARVVKEHMGLFDEASGLLMDILTFNYNSARLKEKIETDLGNIVISAKPYHYKDKVRIKYGMMATNVRVKPIHLYYPMEDVLDWIKEKIMDRFSVLEADIYREYRYKTIVTNRKEFIKTLDERIELAKKLFRL